MGELMQRKPTKNTRGPNADEKRFQAWCKDSDCITCGAPGPSIVHHCEGATFKHNKVLIGHWFCIPLCETCDNVITRGSRKVFRDIYGPQSDYWKAGYEYYKGKSDIPVNCPYEVYKSIMDWGR